MGSYSYNQNVVNAQANENQYGLLEVSFVCEGAPEFPTALRDGVASTGKKFTIYDDPLVAFRNGEATAKYPPQYSYHRANRQIPSWICKSILFADGSVYSKEEAKRVVNNSDKKRVFASSVSEWQYGLKLVEFSGVGLIGGKPIYPTALIGNASIKDKPLDAFWGGEETATIPFEARESDDAIGIVWSAKSIVFADGSAYSKNEVRGSDGLLEKDKLRVHSARVFDAELGLKYVEFQGVGLINGKPIYPTALAEGKSLLDSPLEAFWGGSEAIKLPHSVEISDDNVGVVWTTRVLVNGDGSAISTTQAITLREYYDIVDYNYPSKAYITGNGVQEKPGATRKYKAKIVEKLVMGGALTQNACVIPIHVKQWGFYYAHANNGNLYEAKSIHGALVNPNFTAGTVYRGKAVSNLVIGLRSEPNHATFVASLNGGCVDCQARRAFSDASGNDWYVIRTVTLVDGDFEVH